ncbi:MAG: 50S ribosomal protein L4 [Pseudomonadota bacterium]
MKVAVKTLENKAAGEITLDKAIFGVDVEKNEHTLHAMIKYQRNKARSGNHKAKQRHEVSGTGKKPWAQKGTGRARAGDLKRNIDRGGQVVHGPVVRDHATKLPKKMRQLAFKTALSAKAKDGKLVIIEDATAKDHKTKPMAAALAKFDFKSALIVGGEEIDVNFARATANIPLVDVLPSTGANVYDIVRRDTLVLTKDAVKAITEKLKG